MLRGWLVIVVLSATAASAHAQAPGQVVLQPTPPPPGVMANRWAVGAALGFESLRPTSGATSAMGFGVLELAVRLRVVKTLELALTLEGGGGSVQDAPTVTTQLSTGGLALDARYRFLPDEAWNVYALGGIAVVAAAGKDVSTDARRARGELRLGVGVERRFKQLAFEAELRGEAVGKNQPIPDPPGTPSYALAQNGLLGLALVIGASYYF